MKLVLLGTGGYHPNDRRHTACLMLPDVGIILDAGTGMYRIRDHLATQCVDIFLSHAHLDHVVGLTYLLDVVPREMLPQITVHATPEALSAVRDHLFAERIFPVMPPFGMEALGPPCPLPEAGWLTHFPLPHPNGSVGFRLDWPDRSLAYVTDTTARPDASYIELIRGVDVLVHEAYFPDEADNLPETTGHSSLLASARVAAQAQVGRLVLIHMGPHFGSDESFNLRTGRDIFRETQLGVDGMELEF